jgi:nucleoside-diphosphate-sugar epimerase
MYDVVNTSLDYIFHLAAVLNADSLETYYRVNVGGTKNLIEICLEKKISLKRFVYISSAAAAGPSNKMLKETDACNPVTEYGRSKVATENIFQARKDQIPFTILRPTLVYGPRNFHGIYSYFHFASKGLKLYFGKGMTNIIYVKDLVNCLLLSAEKKEAINQTYFVGEQRIYSFKEIADIISDAFNRRMLPVHVPIFFVYVAGTLLGAYSKVTRTSPLFNLRRARDLKHRYWMYDISKIRRELGFKTQYELKDAAKETIEWYEKEGWIN